MSKKPTALINKSKYIGSEFYWRRALEKYPQKYSPKANRLLFKFCEVCKQKYLSDLDKDEKNICQKCHTNNKIKFQPNYRIHKDDYPDISKIPLNANQSLSTAELFEQKVKQSLNQYAYESKERPRIKLTITKSKCQSCWDFKEVAKGFNSLCYTCITKAFYHGNSKYAS